MEGSPESQGRGIHSGCPPPSSCWKCSTNLTQPLSLGMFRSDYMVHQAESTLQIKQVEFNTIASSFGGLSSQTSQLHEYLARTEYPILHDPIPLGTLSLPQNDSTHLLAHGLGTAFGHYPQSDLRYPRCIIFLVQDGERNIFDQRHIEYALQKASSPPLVFRLAFGDIMKHTSIADTPKRQLLYHLPRSPSKTFEVAVVYLRSGYGPSDYPNASAWEARYQLERSAAIKCPTVLTQVAGMKKVQQLLATPKDILTISILTPAISELLDANPALRSTFTNIYPMDDSPAGLKARELALDPESCKSYVLKPQREGGGNNIYRTSIPSFLKSIPETHWGAYILMELITPPPVANVILRNGHIEQGGVICELGIYGTCVWNQMTGEILHNEEAGYLLRTKGDKSEEGGVAAGYGCMDSCNLV